MGEVFARLYGTRIEWETDRRWPLVRIEAVDPILPPGGPVEFLHWRSNTGQQSAGSYARRAYGARFSNPSHVTAYDMEAWGRAVAEAKRLYGSVIVRLPLLPLKNRFRSGGLEPDFVVYRHGEGLILAGLYRIGVLGWATIEAIESVREGAMYELLVTIVPGRVPLATKEEFYEFIRRSE